MKIILIVFLSLHCTHQLDFKEEKFAMEFLDKYEYLSPDSTTFANRGDVLKKAIVNMQLYAGLTLSGKFDEQTVEKMHSKRCGLPDHELNTVYGAGLGWSQMDLTYEFINFSQDLTRTETRSVIKRAFKLWSDVTPLTFREVNNNADIKILFTVDNHGCKKSFDGQGGILGHAYFPEIGKVHFDDDENFTDGNAGTNLLWVATHEFGHALGLSHSKTKEAIMYAYYGGYSDNFTLYEDDMSRIQAIYGRNPSMPTDAPTLPLPDDCQDERSHVFCKAFVKDCHKDHMIKYCRRTCKCPAVPTTVPASTSKPAPTSTRVCRDEKGESVCRSMMKHCDQYYMKKLCALTCGCPGV